MTSENQQTSRWIAVTGGGSGGHIYPALSVLEAFYKNSTEADAIDTLWIGSKKGLERNILASDSPDRRSVLSRITFEAIPTGKLRRYFSLKNFIDVFLILAGIVRSFFILSKYRPEFLFAKGGYVSVPPVLAAKALKIPVVCHESDLDPGLATKINSRFAEKILIPFEASRRYYRPEYQERLEVVGLPIRETLAESSPERGRRSINYSGTLPVLFVVGGSQGARELNDFVKMHFEVLCASWFVVHQTGKNEKTMREHPNYRPFPYLGTEYGDILSAADCVICRSGATTLWETASFEKAMILVPLGLGSSRGDQILNAAYFEEHNAALVAGSTRRDGPDIFSCAKRLSGDEAERRRLGTAARELIRTDSAFRIAELLDGYTHEEQG